MVCVVGADGISARAKFLEKAITRILFNCFPTSYDWERGKVTLLVFFCLGLVVVSIKLVILDIDGTIAGQANQVRQPVQQAIATVQKQGIPIALATGRMFCSALRFHEQVGSNLPIISYNGALTKHPHTQETLRQWHLPQAIAFDLLDYFETPELRDVLEVHCYYDDQLYVREITLETQRYIARSGIQAQTISDLRKIVEKSTVKLLAISQQQALITELLQELRQKYDPKDVYLTQSTEIYFEATHPHANKGLAVQHLAETILGLKPENIMAIGDNFNDLEMLQYAGVGVAMGNAPASLKAVADWVTEDVEEDGVLHALEKFC